MNAPDHVGGTEPFISTPGFVGIDFVAGERGAGDACKIRTVGYLVVEAPALIRAKRCIRQSLQRLIQLRIRAPQRFDLWNGEHRC